MIDRPGHSKYFEQIIDFEILADSQHLYSSTGVTSLFPFSLSQNHFKFKTLTTLSKI